MLYLQYSIFKENCGITCVKLNIYDNLSYIFNIEYIFLNCKINPFFYNFYKAALGKSF